MNTLTHKRIYSYLAALIEKAEMSRAELIDTVYERLTSGSLGSECEVGCSTSLRGDIGAVIDEMESTGLIGISKKGYRLIAKRPVILRSESLEREVVSSLRTSGKTKAELRSELREIFGTRLTPSSKDDNIISSLLGAILKRLLSLGIIVLDGDTYSISPKKAAKIDDIHEMLALKEEFLIRIHTRGGEYFEHYFMTLLGKYMSKLGKTVRSNKVNGGAMDGGIDGIMETTDQLGFRETVMVQMKNRIDETNETTVRGFYGSVCAYQGTRGIFATTSTFHSAARDFLDNIDNCVGLDGGEIFMMALECQYGIRKKGGRYAIDTKIV